MVNIWIKTDSHYTVNRSRIRKIIKDFLVDRQVRGKVEVSLAVVGDRLMKKLNHKFLQQDVTTNVLAFPLQSVLTEKPFVDPPDGVLRLGDIIISYPQVLSEAADENKLVDDKIDELLVHAMNHLLGQNHQ